MRAVICSKQMGHSLDPPVADRPLVRLRLLIADRVTEDTRKVPMCMDENGRSSYIAIARRAQAEGVNWYTILSLGIRMYQSSRKLKCT